MLNFKKIEISDVDVYNEFMKNNKEFSCENSFVNLLVWANTYGNMIAISENQLFIKSGFGEKETFRLPIGGDLDFGIKEIESYSEKPSFWIQDGQRLKSLGESFNERYEMFENRDAADYIYFSENLAELQGKKYHSKRNHINAFSKKYDWSYEEINSGNIQKIKTCADIWYKENSDKADKYLLAEKKGIDIILDNMDTLGVKVGAITVNNSVVAFSLGSPINDDVFDIHIEKALKDYAEGYTVINREFAKRLTDFKYINREDDMGLEGLRKAKLSYKPEIILKKYFCKPR